MRIRIRRPIAGIIDGVSLSHLVPGLSYDVTDSLAGYLVSSGDADEVSASTPVVEPTDDSADPPIFGGIIVATGLESAPDTARPPRARRKRR